MFSNRPQLAGTIVGTAVTLLSTILLIGLSWDRRLELLAYNERVQLCNTIERDPSIVHIDIDDGSLDKVGRWPWRRDQIADLIRAIHELGAANIMVDILLSEPERPTIDDPSISSNVDIEGETETVGTLSKRNVIYGDIELADAIRRAGNVILATQLEIRSPTQAAPPSKCIAEHWLPEGPNDLQELLRRCGAKDTPENRRKASREVLRQQIKDLLVKNYTMTEQDVAKSLAQNEADIFAVFAGAKAEAASALVRIALPGEPLADPEATWIAVAAKILGDEQGRRSADRRDL